MQKLESMVRESYSARDTELPFHGWHHIAFVLSKAIQFAEERSADAVLVGCAALVHDLNYMVRKNSDPSEAASMRQSYLRQSGFRDAEIARIEEIITEAHTACRGASISREGSALSDADTLFKALPVTPVVFSHRYLDENGISLRMLAKKIIEEQLPLLENGIYFYDDAVRAKYLPWAEANLQLWLQILAALNDPDVTNLLRASGVED
jgi:uncharacterized protein